MAKGDYVTFVAEVYAPGNFTQQEPDLRGGENAYRDFQGLIPTDNPCGVAPAEIGPTSILLSILISVHEATFIVDASSAIRSIAELGMTIFAVNHCYSGDFVVSAGGDYASHFSRQLPSATANEAMQAIANTLTKYDDHYHGAAGFAIYGMDESTLKQVKNLPQNGMQIALKLGQYARLPAAQAYQKIVKELSSITQRPAFVLFEGVIYSVQLNYDKASNQTIGFIEFKHETNDHEFLKVYAVNENVIAFYEFRVSQRVLASKPICIGPDAINYLLMSSHFEQSITFANSDLLADINAFKNKKIGVIGLAMPELRGKPAIDSFLEKIKQAMGQDIAIEYMPVEVLNHFTRQYIQTQIKQNNQHHNLSSKNQSSLS